MEYGMNLKLKSRKNLFMQLAFVLLTTMVMMGCRSNVLYQVPPIATPSGMGSDQVAKEIERTLIERNWMIVNSEPGLITSQLNVRTHSLMIDINYDETNIKVKYKSSTNLRYSKDDDGTEYIHKKYTSWMKNIEKDLHKNLRLAQY